MDLVARRFEVWLVALDPTIGSEIRKARPCVIISPDEMNRYIRTRIIAPMTTKGGRYPSRVQCTFDGKDGQIVIDQIRTVDRARLIRKLGSISDTEANSVLSVLATMFAR